MTSSVLQYVLYIVILVALGYPLGMYMGKIMNGEKNLLSKIFLPLESFVYKLFGVRAEEEMNWKTYAMSAVMFSVVGIVCLWLFQFFQHLLPFNPEGQRGVSWFLAFNTAASFMTNTNWQCYNAENTLSYFSQAMGLLVQNFVSAATGIAVMFAVIRGLFRTKTDGLGSFWVDMVRIHLYILIPLCVIGAMLIISQGVPQTMKGSERVALLEPIVVMYDVDNAVNGHPNPDDFEVVEGAIVRDGRAFEVVTVTETISETITNENGEDTVITREVTRDVEQEIAGAVVVTHQVAPRGPAASQIAMKQLGTNGGGFYGLNSTHPYENSTPLSNLLQMLYLLLIPVGCCFTLGRNLKNVKFGYAIFAAMFIMLVGAMFVSAYYEHAGTPQLAQNGAVNIEPGLTAINGIDVDHAGGNMEGKESRHGIATSVTWAVWTTAASNGSVNSMHDSYTPIGGLVPTVLMQLGEVVFGGVGCGLYGMLAFAILTVFIAGLMVGRTPEFLGKKIEPYEMKWASLVCLATPIGILVGSGLAALLTSTHASLDDPGMHGFSELIYAYTSGGGNNGSAFAGFNSNTPFIAVSHGLVMIFVRFLPMIGCLAFAGSLARKKQLATTAGTLSTTNMMFVFLLIFVVLLVGALSFLPALALGPIAEHFSRMIGGF